ncbi:MAG: ATP synthase subunit I [Halanaerobiales bacterium]
MKYIDDPARMQIEVIKKTFYMGLVPLIYSLILGKIEVFLGLLLGLIISILLLRLKFLHIKRSLNMEEDKANSFIRNRYFIQYIIYFAVLMTAFRNPSVNFLAAVVGLFLMKITVIIWVVVDIIKNGWQKRLESYYK